MGSGQSQQQSQLGMLGSKQQGQGQGGGQAQASGQRSPGSPEDVTFKRQKLKANEMDRNGEIIAVLPFNGDMPKGEALQEYREALKTAQTRSEQVNKEAIPRERQDMVRRYMRTLVEPVGGVPEESGSPGTSGSDGDGASTEGR